MIDVNQFIDPGLRKLERLDEQARHQKVQTYLNKAVARMNANDGRIQEIIDTYKKGEAGEQLIQYLGRGIVEATKGSITVKAYQQKAQSEQDVYIYVGTHWKSIDPQIFYDFIHDCCERSGLPDTYLYSPTWMCRLTETVAFMVSRHREQYVPYGQVFINLQNGTLVIDSQGGVNLRPHDPDDFFTYCLSYGYQPEATCPLWMKFLGDVLPDKDTQDVLSEITGYCFTASDWLRLERFGVLYGSGSNGKSVIEIILTNLFGRENVSSVDLEKLTTDDNQRSLIEGKLANISTESGAKVNAAMLKTIVSGEPVMVKTLYKNPKTITNYGKLIVSYNQLPQSEATLGFFRRWLIIPFNVTIPEDRRDVNLPQKLCRELPGILNWVIVGLQRLVRNRAFTSSEECEKALKRYKLSTNSALRFLAERVEKCDEGRLTLKEIYTEYVKFCYDDGVQNRYGRNNFAEQLRQWGATVVTAHAGTKYYQVKFNGIVE